jgi:hypothetical protein
MVGGRPTPGSKPGISNRPLKPQVPVKFPVRGEKMAKKLKAIVRLQIEAGKANPAPPIGPALAGHGINIMQFCK